MQSLSPYTRTTTESSWREFLDWIEFSTLSEALERKHRSLNDWAALKLIAPSLFSIEYGLDVALRKWKTTRKLWYPREKSVHDAYSFVCSCIDLKRELSFDQARIFRSRVISEILPNGRLCRLDQEFRAAQNLKEFGWRILHSGFCGAPGPDFIAERAGVEIELETKCISPELGLGISYELAVRLIGKISRELRSEHPDSFTTIRIDIPGEVSEADSMEAVCRRVIDCYKTGEDFTSHLLSVRVEIGSLEAFLTRFPNFKTDDWLRTTFEAIRSKEGDYGYFIRRDSELVFCNLVPTRPNQQAKKLMKLISSTCERQFSKNRPALLWLHLQGLAPDQMERDPAGVFAIFERLTRHAFGNKRRAHLSALVFSSDSELEHEQALINGRSARKVQATGRANGFSNPHCRFEPVNVFAPLVSVNT